MLTYTTDQWVIIGLVFVLGLLIGTWMTSGGRRKWKARYNDEVTARKTAETQLKEREADWATREKEWREQDSRRDAALRDRPAVADDRGPYVDERMRDRHPDDLPHRRPGDIDGDGVPNRGDARPADRDRY